MPVLLRDKGFSRLIREIEDNVRILKKSLKKDKYREVLAPSLYRISDRTAEDALDINRNLDSDNEQLVMDIEPLLKEVEYLCLSPGPTKRGYSGPTENVSSRFLC